MEGITNEQWIEQRAAEIHAERRALFSFGPPPYTAMAVVKLKDGEHVNIRVRADSLDVVLFQIITPLAKHAAASEDPDFVVRFGLAMMEAANERFLASMAAVGDAGVMGVACG